MCSLQTRRRGQATESVVGQTSPMNAQLCLSRLERGVGRFRIGTRGPQGINSRAYLRDVLERLLPAGHSMSSAVCCPGGVTEAKEAACSAPGRPAGSTGPG